MTDTLTIKEVLEECAKCPELISQYERVRGVRLHGGSPIEQMVDESSGYKEEKWKEFFDFCVEYIYLPVLFKQVP